MDELLERALMYVHRGFITGTFAVDKDGVSCDPSADRAVKWDAEGALMAAFGVSSVMDGANGSQFQHALELLESFATDLFGVDDLGKLSDKHKIADIIQVYDMSIDYLWGQDGFVGVSTAAERGTQDKDKQGS